MLEQHQDFKDATIEIIKNYFNDEFHGGLYESALDHISSECAFRI